ncbi:MAG: rod shape-determining protein MreD [Alphaproteobacteria bacterium]|nr:MAG: rod shape-determining protein MreD [Alphaproteobacteria bacterium]
MVDPRALRRWFNRALYLALCAFLIFLDILPISVDAGRYPGPDLMLALTFAIVMRRPRHLPAPLIAAVFLATDLFYMRPPGLWTAMVVLGTEYLRAHQSINEETPFASEWATVAGTLVAMTLGYRALLWLAMVPQPPLALVAAGLAATLIAYPVVVLGVRQILRIRRAAPGEVDPLEGRV